MSVLVKFQPGLIFKSYDGVTQVEWRQPYRKCYTRVEFPEILQRASLLRYGINYCRKKFYETDKGPVIQNFLVP